MVKWKALIGGAVLSIQTFVCADAIPDMLVSSYGGGAALIKENRVVWSFGKGIKPCQDSWKLHNGNYLIPTGDTVQIINDDLEVLWKYKGKTLVKQAVPKKGPNKGKKPKNLEIHSCQPLPDGKFLITEGGNGRFVEVDSEGIVEKVIKLEGEVANNHSYNRVVRKTKQGTYVATLNKDRIGEYDSSGKLLRMIDSKITEAAGIQWKHVHGLIVLDNGNWLIGAGKSGHFFEIDTNNKVVWTLKPEDVPEIGLAYAAGGHRLKDGTTVLTALKSGYQVFAVNKDKNVLWKWKAPADAKHLGFITNVQILSEKGDPSLFQLQK